MKIVVSLAIGLAIGVATTLVFNKSRPAPTLLVVETLATATSLALSMRVLSQEPSARECDLLQTAYLSYRFLEVDIKELSESSSSPFLDEDLKGLEELLSEYEATYETEKLPDCD